MSNPATAYSLFGGCHYPAPLNTSPKFARDLNPPRICGYRTPPPQKGAGHDMHTLLCLLGAEDLRLLGTRRDHAVPFGHDGSRPPHRRTSPAAPPPLGTRAGDPPPRKAVPWRSLPPPRPATEGATAYHTDH